MLSALLGAICAVSMACAPALVEPSSNGLNNDGDFTSVHGAYYDADNVADYGSTAGQLYNYTESVIYGGSDGVQNENYALDANSSIHAELASNSSVFMTFNMATSNAFNSYIFCTSIASLDWYIDGVFVSTTSPAETDGYYVHSLVASGYNWLSGHYFWLFDHYEAPAYELGTDTVADIAEGLTGGIGTIATGIGGGLQSLVRNIFLVGTYDAEGNFTATGLSTFGIVTIVMASLSLALGLSRWVVGWASSLGERNR